MILKFDNNEEELEKVIDKNEFVMQDKLPASAKESVAKGKKESKLWRLVPVISYLISCKDTFCL